MNFTRRSFLKTSGLLASGTALGSISLLSSCARSNPQTTPFGLQLYTLRDIISDDPEGVLRQVAEFGYNQIESYEGPEGMFWGLGNTGFSQLMDDLGMELVSSHANVFEEVERKIEELAAIGAEFIVCPYLGPQESLDDFREIADQFNEIGELAQNAGIRFAYHNHDYSFVELESELPQHLLMERTDPGLVEFQLDIYWVVYAGENPADWIVQYPGRFTSSHVKDYSGGENPESTILGTGTIGFPELLRLGSENGMEYFIVEQEAYTGTTPLGAVEQNARYMAELDLEI